MPRVVRRCTDCDGQGSTEQITGHDRRGMGGGMLLTKENVCTDCEGSGRVLDSQWEEWAKGLAWIRVKCSCGWSGHADEFWYWEVADGFGVNCLNCDSTLLISMACAEAQMPPTENAS